jgi:gamma-glutamyl-gamma-aminobutyrate hydrolase PuuD
MKSVLVTYRHHSEVTPYADAIAAAGLDPHLVRAGADVHLDGSAGLLLTGGTDVEPALYGEDALPETDEPDRERDLVEKRLIDETLAADIPVLAICRGLQLLNVHLGGTLYQHLPTTDRHVRRTPDRGLPAHSVSITPGTLLAGVAGRERWQVNSRHHQAAKTLGAGLVVCAVDPEDGVIEAVELRGRRFCLAVQWHPENQAVNDAEQRKIFQSFTEAV